MRASGRLQLYSIILLFLATFTAAWPWPRWLPDLDTLVVRADPSDSPSPPAPTETGNSSPKSTGDNKSQSGSSLPSKSGSVSPSRTGSKTGSITAAPTKGDSDTSDGNSSSTTYRTQYDPQIRPGGVSLLEPAITAGPQFYKVDDWVTFAWNYTSLLGTPKAVNVMATCTTNSQLYTIASNQTVSNATNTVYWDTGAYQTTAIASPLIVGIYTLIIYDADTEMTAPPEPGYLAPYNQYTFGMYTKQPYSEPTPGYRCATCSGALSDTERRALGMVLGMGVLTVFSFTWFVTGLQVIW
ncbi:uncharacterized protein BP5553_09501 [Venustampulla echinocandica]|uniref:DUF7137 domain-containing protein n=1 Tax=Venustampulla echinocandica TaxID=2656787 RepID=A0A370TCW1_9HELO|nr:uncharacterized protein BP5553_09501 [Venustampulla echinocandica]RDL32099.1 hypothetical protein BP5553_09501 [Venustampulla echinocandica]